MLAQHIDAISQPSTSLTSTSATPDVPPASTLLAPNLPQLTTATQADLDQLTALQSSPPTLPPIPPPSSVSSTPSGSSTSAPSGTLSGSPSSPAASDAPISSPLPQSSASPALPASSPPASSPPSTSSPILHAPIPAPTLSLPSSATIGIDPAEQVAPPGIDIQPGPLPISPLEAIAMRQDIEALIGRFESALLSANAIAYDSSLTLDPNGQDDSVDPEQAQVSLDEDTNAAQKGTDSEEEVANSDASVLVASSTGTLGIASHEVDGNVTRLQNTESPATNSPVTDPQAIVVEAEQLLDQFADALGTSDYNAARTHWLNARQLLWDNFPSDRPIQQSEIRAIWFDRGSIVAAGSRQGLAEIFDRLAAAGINTIFFETINAGYPIYPSAIAPVQNPLIPSTWDPLADAVDLAHERGIELHAWVWAFAAGNQRHNTLIHLPQSYPGPILDAHLDWANYDDRGRIIPTGQTKPFLDPANPEVRNYLQQIFTEIVTQYEVDGLQLDYIRYPFQDPSGGRYYGYGQAARQQFQQQTGVDPLTITPSNVEQWQEWTDFRTQQIDTFISEISAHLRQQRPDLILSTAVFPIPTHERLHKLQQNWEQWAEQGDIDLIVTMSYAMDTNRLQQLTSPWLLDEATTVGPALVVPGIRLLDLPDSAAIDQIQALRDMPSGGYALFAVENLNNNPQLQDIFNQTQGQPTGAIPYRQPFATAVERFEALSREWNFALSTDQLWIRETELTTWKEQSHALQASLMQLATQPSLPQLTQTQAELEHYQQQFEQWMALYALEDEYRVQTWGHHLAVVQRLLDYGEHQLRIGQEFP
ncbi:MAG: family 10 glycosylhydrolase [Merismopedia sp. SIO2A8]|nr:family 10 glycosylhydrolase [Merismopedia sp. SIO2A8]